MIQLPVIEMECMIMIGWEWMRGTRENLSSHILVTIWGFYFMMAQPPTIDVNIETKKANSLTSMSQFGLTKI